MPRPPVRMPYSNGPTGPGNPPRHRFPNPRPSSNYVHRNPKDYHPHPNDSSYPVNPTKEGFAALSSSLQNSIGSFTNKASSMSGSTPNPHPPNNHVNHSNSSPSTPSLANPQQYERNQDRNSMEYHSNSNNARVGSGSNDRQSYTNNFPQRGSNDRYRNDCAPRLDDTNLSLNENNTPRRYLNNGNTENYPNSNGVLKTSAYEETGPLANVHGRRPISEGGYNFRNQAHAAGQWSDQRPNSTPSRPERSPEVNQVGRNWAAQQKATMVATSMSPDVLLRNYRSLECSVCFNHFGFQTRNQPCPQNLFCSAACLIGTPDQFQQRSTFEQQFQRPYEQYQGRNYEPQPQPQGNGGADQSAERSGSGSVPWSPPPVNSVGPPVMVNPNTTAPVRGRGPISTERKSGHGYGGENRHRVNNAVGQGERAEGNGGLANRPIAVAARGGQGDRRGPNHPEKSPFIHAEDDDLGLMITSPTRDDDAVDNKVVVTKVRDLRAVCEEVVTQTKPQQSSKPREVKQPVPPTRDVETKVAVTKDVVAETKATKDVDVEAKSTNEVISSQPKTNAVPPNPADVKTVHVYPNPILYSLSPKLGWSDFPLQEPSIVHLTHENSATDFFAQTAAVHRSAVSMGEHIYVHMEKEESKSQILEDAELYDLCLAPFCEEYYRGEIIEMLPENRAKIFFSDYGNIEVIPLADLIQLPPPFALEPRLISNCQWDMALAGELGQVEARKLIVGNVEPIIATDMLVDGQYIVKLELYTRSTRLIKHHTPKAVKASGSVPNAASSAPRPTSKVPPKAELPTRQTEETITSRQAVPAATPIKSTPSVEKVTVKSTPLADILTAPKPLMPKVAPPRVAPPRPALAAAPQPVAIPPKKSNRKKYIFADMPLTKNIQPNGDVRLAFCWNMSRFFVTADNDGSDAFVVQGLISKNLPDCKGLEGDLPTVGEVLLGDYGDGEYYRAVVTDVDTATNMANIEFIDFGDSAPIKFERLRIPVEEIMTHPVYGMAVYLDLQQKSPPPEVTAENPPALSSLFAKPMQIEFPAGKFESNAKVNLWMNENETLNDFVDGCFQRYATKGHF